MANQTIKDLLVAYNIVAYINEHSKVKSIYSCQKLKRLSFFVINILNLPSMFTHMPQGYKRLMNL